MVSLMTGTDLHTNKIDIQSVRYLCQPTLFYKFEQLKHIEL